MTFGLPEKERLKGKRAVSALLTGGRWGFTTHLKYCWRVREEEETGPARMMVSVPKRLFKRAVRRNLFKRRMREAYRIGKHRLDGRQVDLMLQYNTKEILEYREIRSQVDTILDRIANENHE